MKQVVRVQTLYSFKKKDGSLIPRGIYSADTPGGIPDVVVAEAIAGKTTVRVLEWREVAEPVKKVEKVEVEEPIAEEETSEETELEEEASEEEEEVVEEKPKTARRKRK